MDSAFGPKFAASVAEWMAAETVQKIFVSVSYLSFFLGKREKLVVRTPFSVLTVSSFLLAVRRGVTWYGIIRFILAKDALFGACAFKTYSRVAHQVLARAVDTRVAFEVSWVQCRLGRSTGFSNGVVSSLSVFRRREICSLIRRKGARRPLDCALTVSLSALGTAVGRGCVRDVRGICFAG